MAQELICPHCGSSEVRQVWYNRFKDGLIVPAYPAIDDGIWDCAACGREFEADIAALVADEPPDRIVIHTLYGTITAKRMRIMGVLTAVEPADQARMMAERPVVTYNYGKRWLPG